MQTTCSVEFAHFHFSRWVSRAIAYKLLNLTGQIMSGSKITHCCMEYMGTTKDPWFDTMATWTGGRYLPYLQRHGHHICTVTVPVLRDYTHVLETVNTGAIDKWSYLRQWYTLGRCRAVDCVSLCNLSLECIGQQPYRYCLFPGQLARYLSRRFSTTWS